MGFPNSSWSVKVKGSSSSKREVNTSRKGTFIIAALNNSGLMLIAVPFKGL